MKKLLLLFGLSLLFFQSNAQELEPIESKGKVFYYGDVAVSRRTIQEIVKVNPAAFQEVKRGRSRITWAYVIGFTGAALMGGGIGSAIVGEEYEDNEGYLDPLTGIIGGGLMMVGSIPLIMSGAKKFVNGVEIYNSKIVTSNNPNGVSVNLGLSNHGIGLTVRF